MESVTKSSKPTFDEAVAALDENQREFYEERAGILEYEAYLKREAAELEALIQTRRFFHL